MIRHSFTAAAILLTLVSCSPRGRLPDTVLRIQEVENGLMEFESPADVMFQPSEPRLEARHALAARMEHYGVPGASLAVLDDGRVEWAKSYGTMDVDTGEPVTGETIFEVGSISKVFTAVMALHFVQEGLISLDRDVNEYLKSWQIPENEFTLDQKVTLRLLLTHRAGFPNSNFRYDESIGIPTLVEIVSGSSPAINLPAIPERVPGTHWQYSNVSFLLVELMLQDVTGKSFQQIAEEKIFGPLGMCDSQFNYPLDPAQRRREAMPHDAEGRSREPMMQLPAHGCGGLTATATDVAKFANELILSYHGESEKILNRETTRLLLGKQCDDVSSEIHGIPFSIGLGVFLMGEGEDSIFLHLGGNNPGFKSWMVCWPERRTGIVILTNGVDGRRFGLEVIASFVDEYCQ